MKKHICIALGLVIGVFTTFELSLANAKGKNEKSNIGTEHHFDGMSIGGRYQTPSEAVVTVEDEKVIEDLLGIRKDFKDRVQNELKMSSKRRSL